MTINLLHVVIKKLVSTTILDIIYYRYVYSNGEFYLMVYIYNKLILNSKLRGLDGPGHFMTILIS